MSERNRCATIVLSFIAAFLMAAASSAQATAPYVRTDQELGPVVEDWVQFLGVTLGDREALLAFLATRPNASKQHEEPDGLDQVGPLCASLWDKAYKLASR